MAHTADRLDILRLLLLAAIVGCQSGGDDDSMMAPPAMDAAIVPSEAGSGGLGGATAGTGGAGASAGQAGHDAATDAAGTNDSGSDASGLDASVPPEVTHVYVGGYGTEIAHFVLDRASGELLQRGATSAGSAPSYLAVHPQRDALYAINEQNDAAASQALAFAIDSEDGELSMLNAVVSGGEGAPHLAVHPSGRWLGVAHYGSGHVSILSVNEDRSLGGVTDTDRGPGDTARKAHQVVFDALGTMLLVPCLESDYVLQYRFNDGNLVPNTPPTATVSGGPRHLAISPDQSRAYALSELSSSLTSFIYDSATGQLSSPQTIDSEEDTKGASAHIAIHPNGKWLYVSNRTENSVGVFAIDDDGRPSPAQFVRDGIAMPRDFAIDPHGEFLIVANQASTEDLRVYRIDPDDGTLTFMRATHVGGQPTSVVFALLPQ